MREGEPRSLRLRSWSRLKSCYSPRLLWRTFAQARTVVIGFNTKAERVVRRKASCSSVKSIEDQPCIRYGREKFDRNSDFDSSSRSGRRNSTVGNPKCHLCTFVKPLFEGT